MIRNKHFDSGYPEQAAPWIEEFPVYSMYWSIDHLYIQERFFLSQCCIRIYITGKTGYNIRFAQKVQSCFESHNF